jgi:hypothetical protein
MTFASGDDKVLEDFSAPFVDQKIAGDYQYLTALGNNVYGTFAGRGRAAAQNQNGFDRSFSIDPFFFSFALPQLMITAAGNSVILTWPTNAVGFTLQSTTNLASPSAWTTNSLAPIVIGDQNVLTNPTTSSQQFYRLIGN